MSDTSAVEQETPVVEEHEVLYTNVPVSESELKELAEDYHIIHVESLATPIVEDDDEEDWKIISEGDDTKANEERNKIRFLAKKQPHMKRALRLYETYTFGSDFRIDLKPEYDDSEDVSDEQKKKDAKTIKQASRLWRNFLRANHKWWSPTELGRRSWRDGEQFTRKFSKDGEWPAVLKFIDPERIGDPVVGDYSERKTKGIITDPKDVTDVLQYILLDKDGQEKEEEIDASEVFHSKIDVDSTEKRGVSRFSSVIVSLRLYDGLIRNEVTHRMAQSSIILVRKVLGGRSAAQGLLDNAKTSTTTYTEGTLNREKWRSGTILTVSQGTEVDFAQPQSTFSDASPLAKVLLQQVCAATGFTYSQLSADASDGNFASSLVNESPVLQMIKDERRYFRDELDPIYRWVIEQAVRAGELDGYTESNLEEFWEQFEPECVFGDIVTRDELKIAQTINLGIMNGSLSVQEGSRQMGVDPEKMAREREEEAERGIAMMKDMGAMNPALDDKQDSSDSNADASGKNQGGDDKPAGHKDNQAGT